MPYLSDAFDSCIDFLFGYADGAVEVATLPNGAIICFIVDGTDGRAL